MTKVTGDNLASLFNRLSNKLNAQVGPGWVKYEYNGGYWDLSDGQFRLHYTLLQISLTNAQNYRRGLFYIRMEARPHRWIFCISSSICS